MSVKTKATVKKAVSKSRVTRETEFKGNPMLEFSSDSRFPFSFGVRKLRAIMEAEDEVREFLAKYPPATKE